MAKHTPGPWEIVYRDDDHCMTMTVIAPAGSMGKSSNICRLSDDKNQANVIAITWHQITPWAGQEAFNNDESDANDNLIAAAPDLLEVILAIKNWDIENYKLDIPLEIRKQMQAAIDKATSSES